MDVLFTRKEVRGYQWFGSRILQERGEDIPVNSKYTPLKMKRCREKTTSACAIYEFTLIHLQGFLILKNNIFFII